MATPSARLRALLKRPGPVLLVGAHNALSAKLIEEAGFDGVWSSSFEVSASHGVPDANILTMAEMLDATQQMIRAVSIPVLADCDNGYGNAINVKRAVEAFEAAGAAGIAIEDNQFPKRCSFYTGVRRELASLEEHAGKVRAAKQTQRSRNFVVVARTEALIAGWGLEEALRRAQAYARAGADAILVHSKSSDPGEIYEFSKRWTLKTPLVSVPTIYKTVTAKELSRHGYKVVIFANHAVRSAIRGMQESLAALRSRQQAAAIDDRIAPLEEVYRLIGVSEMKQDERDFLPKGPPPARAIILAAGFEKELLPLIADKPRAMLEVKGKSILERQVELLRAAGVHDIVVVRGYKKETVQVPGVQLVDHDRYRTEGPAGSLFAAGDRLQGRIIVLYSDILFDQSILEKALKAPGTVKVVVDRSFSEAADGHARPAQLVQTAGNRSIRITRRFIPGHAGARVLRIGRKLPGRQAHGEFIGMAVLEAPGVEALKKVWRLARARKGRFHEAPSARRSGITDLVQELIAQGHRVNTVDVYKGWIDIDSFEDYQRAWARIK